MILADAPWRSRPTLMRLAEALGGDAETRIVGGAVRDTLLGLPVSDIDLATIHAPDAIEQRARKVGYKPIPTGKAHGTITVVLPDGPVEVTTLRRDVATDGRHATVAFTADWGADAARRDFTINALYADPAGARIHDFFGGLGDLEARIVRFIGDPHERIAEDHLRTLRFFRFHARFGQGAPEAAGLAACTARARDLMALSRERIAQELLKLLAVEDPVPAVRVMIAHGIFAPILPEISETGADRLARLCARERAAGDADPVRRLAALLPPDPATADAVGARLRLSKAQRRRLATAADGTARGDPHAIAYAIGIEGARDRMLVHLPDGEAEAALAAIEGWTPPRLPIGGGALVELGLSAGPQVAAVLQATERRWIAEGFPDEVRVRAIARALVDQALRAR